MTTLQNDLNCLADQGRIRKTRGVVSYIVSVTIMTNDIDMVSQLRKSNLKVIPPCGIVNYSQNVIAGPTIIKILA